MTLDERRTESDGDVIVKIYPCGQFESNGAVSVEKNHVFRGGQAIYLPAMIRVNFFAGIGEDLSRFQKAIERGRVVADQLDVERPEGSFYSPSVGEDANV